MFNLDSYFGMNGLENHLTMQDDLDRRAELEAIIGQLEQENVALQQEYERLKLERLSTIKRQSMLEDGYGSGGTDNDLPADFPPSLLREQLLSDANVLRVQRERLDEQMQQLERHNKQLHEQLVRLKGMLGNNTCQIPPLSGCALDKPLPPSNSFGAAAAAAANACNTTSILKSSNSLHRPSANKSIHFSNNHVVLDDYGELR